MNKVDEINERITSFVRCDSVQTPSGCVKLLVASSSQVILECSEHQVSAGQGVVDLTFLGGITPVAREGT